MYNYIVYRINIIIFVPIHVQINYDNYITNLYLNIMRRLINVMFYVYLPKIKIYQLLVPTYNNYY